MQANLSGAKPSLPGREAVPGGRSGVEEAWGGVLWRGSELAGSGGRTLPSGHRALDLELPGGGWPCEGLTEVMLAQPVGCEWRLLGPALRRWSAGGGVVMLVGAPGGFMPHAPALQAAGLSPKQVVWVPAGEGKPCLWAAEQALQCPQVAAVLAWLPRVTPAALRRLQMHAQRAGVPAFVFRPLAAAQESSPAPLRLSVSPARAWSLGVRLLKRRGPLHEGLIELPALPLRLAGVMAPRLRAAGQARVRGASAAPGGVPLPLHALPEQTDVLLAGIDRPAFVTAG